MSNLAPKPISYWQAKAMAARRAELRERMLTGDAESAKQLLSRAVGSLAAAINTGAMAEHDEIALDYLRTSILDFLDGVTLDVAFGIANKSGGRPRVSLSRKLEIFGALSNEIERLKQAGSNQPITHAQKNIARRFGVSVATVRRVYDNNV